MQSDQFRKLCSRFATGVTVVTTSGPALEAAPAGMTVSSFTSVSLEPPLILVCLRNESRLTRQFIDAEHFGVNVLHEDQQEVSRQFAQRGVMQGFEGIPWHRGPYFVPVLEEVLAHFICAKEGSVTRGDHVVLFGRVVDGSYSQQKHPLIHWDSNYHRLQPDATMPASGAVPLRAVARDRVRCFHNGVEHGTAATGLTRETAL
jgi:(E)-2-((N-methylformamido)methylene)succinate hydrolase